jgi:hypothetical protein
MDKVPAYAAFALHAGQFEFGGEAEPPRSI